MYARIRARWGRRPALVAVATALVLVLGACETEPATDVTATEATLNAKARCYKGLKGWSRFQLNDGSGFVGVGDRYDYDCPGDSGYVRFDPPRRIGGLTPGRAYEFRLRTELSDGQKFWTDADGTQGGTNYDWFVTPASYTDEGEDPPEGWLSRDPETGEPIASAAGPCGAPKEISNPRRGRSWPFGTHLWTIRLTTAWKFCNGQITKMYPASSACWVTSAGAAAGWRCLHHGRKVRAISTGGDPEHAVYTYEFDFQQQVPIKGGITIASKHWCATNQISGSGAHRRHGSCDVQPW